MSSCEYHTCAQMVLELIPDDLPLLSGMHIICPAIVHRIADGPVLGHINQ